MFSGKVQAQKYFDNGMAYLTLARNYQMAMAFTKQDDLKETIDKVYQDAIHHLSLAIKYNPEHVQGHCLRGSIYQRQQNYELAIDDFFHALLVDIHNQEVIKLIVNCLVAGPPLTRQTLDNLINSLVDDNFKQDIQRVIKAGQQQIAPTQAAVVMAKVK